MGVNQVYYGDSPLVDLTGDTVTPETLLQGETAHNAAGNPITGTARPGVQSFNGRNGSVLPMAGDYSAEQVNYDSNQTVKQKIDALVTKETSDITGQQSLVKDTVGWTGKNLLKNEATTQTKNGVTFTVNADKSVTVNGTVTTGYNPELFLLNKTTSNKHAGCILSCGVSNTSDVYMRIRIGNSSTGTYIREIKGDNIIIPTLESGQDYYIAIRCVDGTTINNLTFYPMLRKADITDPTYEPYHESVEVMYEEEIHGVNLLENKATTQTVNGITFTVNSDGSVKANGTGTTLWAVLFLNSIALPKGSYILSGTPANANCYLVMRNNGVTLYNTSNGQDKIIELSEDTTFDTVQINIAPGTTISDLVFYPMLRKADIEDSTYRPYNEQAIQNQLNAQTGILGAKNLLNHVLTSQTSDGVTINVDDKKIITLNGTSTSDFTVILLPKEDLNALLAKYGNLILNGSDPVKYTDARIITKSGSYIIDNGTGILLDASKTYENNLSLQIFNGKTFNNLKIKPMLRLASDPDDTYVPYAMTNRELTEKVFEKRTLTSADDLNNITETGIYGITTAPVNSPEATTYCTLLVKANSSNDIKQIIFEARSAGGYIYIRSYGSNAWGSWYKFTGTVVS